MMAQTQIPDENYLSTRVAQFIPQPEFRFFLASCMKKWDQMQPEMEMISLIMDSVCKSWNCNSDQLLKDRQFAEARYFFFYVIHKKLQLTYGTIGNMFDRGKAHVHVGAKNIEFLLDKRRQKHLVLAFEGVELALMSAKP